MTPKKRTGSPHPPTACIRDADDIGGTTTVRFVCPLCGRETYQLKNAISGRRVWCDGVVLKRLTLEVDLSFSQDN